MLSTTVQTCADIFSGGIEITSTVDVSIAESYACAKVNRNNIPAPIRIAITAAA